MEKVPQVVGGIPPLPLLLQRPSTVWSALALVQGSVKGEGEAGRPLLGRHPPHPGSHPGALSALTHTDLPN